ncbi:MAG: restriction endonuclease [Chitinophagales bacterium]
MLTIEEFTHILLKDINSNLKENFGYTVEKSIYLVAKKFKYTIPDNTTKRGFRIINGKRNVCKKIASIAEEYLHQCGFLLKDYKNNWAITPTGLSFLKKRLGVSSLVKRFHQSKNWSKLHENKYDALQMVLENISIDVFVNDLDKYIDTDVNDILMKKICSFNERELEYVIAKIISDITGGEAQITRYSKDGGIDGVIKINNGFFGYIILIQVKHYSNKSIPLKDVRSFAGAVSDNKEYPNARGIFFTTSRFTKDALSYTKSHSTPIVLTNLEQFVNTMIDNEVGIFNTALGFRIDSHYFSEIRKDLRRLKREK